MLTSFYSLSQVEYTRVLDANNVSALITDEGTFFQDQAQSIARYEVPKGSGKNVIYNMAPWFGMKDVNNQINVAADTYVGYHLRSGPVADQMAYSNPQYQAVYQEGIWSVTLDEINYHIQNYQSPGYVPISDIAKWPGNGEVSLGIAPQLAPYVDANNDGVYNPMDGDYPEIMGDQTVYVIMHDYPANLQTTYMGIEVHVMAYQFNMGGYMGNTTFLNFKVYNRSTMNYHDYRQAIYMDADVGNYMDDYVGCDSLRNLAYAYNGDNYDEDNGGNVGYNQYPPCVGIMSLSHQMDYFCYFTNGGAYPYSDPNVALEYWNFMNGMWANGQPWVYGGTGFPGSYGATNIPSSYMFSGSPIDSVGWSELNTDGYYSSNDPGDRRFFMTISESNFGVGDMICSDYAILFDKTDLSPFQNVVNVKNIATSLQSLYDQNRSFPCSQAWLGLEEEQHEIARAEIQVYPNPSNGNFNVDLVEMTDQVSVSILDCTGREIFRKEYGQVQHIEFSLKEKPGLYFIRLNSKHDNFTQRLIIK